MSGSVGRVVDGLECTLYGSVHVWCVAMRAILRVYVCDWVDVIV